MDDAFDWDDMFVTTGESYTKRSKPDFPVNHLVQFSTVEKYYINMLLLIGEAFPNGYKSDKYKYFFNKCTQTGITVCVLLVSGRMYTIKVDSFYNSCLLYCSEDFEEVAKEFCEHLCNQYWQESSEEEVNFEDDYAYFVYHEKVWKLPDNLAVLVCLRKSTGSFDSTELLAPEVYIPMSELEPPSDIERRG